MIIWTQDLWNPFRASRRVVFWADPGDAGGVSTGEFGEVTGPAMGGTGPTASGVDTSMDIFGMMSQAVNEGTNPFGSVPGLSTMGLGMTPSGMGAMQGIKYGLTHLNPDVQKGLFKVGMRKGANPSQAASYSSEMAMPNPNEAMMNFAANTALSAPFSAASFAFGVPNVMSLANFAGLDPAGILGIHPSMVAPSLSTGEPEGGDSSSMMLSEYPGLTEFLKIHPEYAQYLRRSYYA